MGGDGPGLGMPRTSRGGRRCGIDPRPVPPGRAWGALRAPQHRRARTKECNRAGGKCSPPPTHRGIPAPTRALTQPPGAPRPPGRGTGGSPCSVSGAAPPELLSLGVSGAGQEAAGPPPLPAIRAPPGPARTPEPPRAPPEHPHGGGQQPLTLKERWNPGISDFFCTILLRGEAGGGVAGRNEGGAAK